ncbi:MAG: hypothetical protein B7Y95_06045 [Rhizobiales bacterium 32-66-11]|jgi:predicted nucleic acid-binding protein|nr:MAG: hypothetical protein B7Y95_06045 [Rhizobiales bacterium 32-66-11]
MSPFVVDASVALKWFFEEDDTQQAEALAASPDELFAPTLILTEVANALWKKMRRSEAVEVPAALQICEYLPGFFTEMVPVEPLLPHAVALSFALDHPIYDCVYLSLAYTKKCPLVTSDRRLIHKAEGQPLTPRLLHLSQWRP